MTRPALRVIRGEGGGGAARLTAAPPSRESKLLDIARELARAATLAHEAADCDDDFGREFIDEATGRARAALAMLEVLDG